MKSKTIRIYEQGSVNVLNIEEIEVKDPSENEVSIEHHYAGLNYIDINQRNGAYPLKTLPSSMGMEASGIVIKTGKNVIKFKALEKCC